MSAGAYALYVDVQAGSGGGGGGGGGAGAPIDRIIPLPSLTDRHIHFNDRRLTLSYDADPPTSLPSLTVGARFLGTSSPPVSLTVPGGECLVVDVPRDACAVYLHVDPPPAGHIRGPLSALVEYDS